MEINTLSANPTTLELLKAGATITLPSGYYLKGRDSGYIELGKEGYSLGVRNLSQTGLEMSIADIKEDAEEEERLRQEADAEFLESELEFAAI